MISRKKIVSTTAPGLGAMALALTLSACAGGTLGRLGSGGNELPKELPQEMQQKFEVKEVAEVAPSPSPSPSVMPQLSAAPVPVLLRQTAIGKKKHKATQATVQPALLTQPPAQSKPAPAVYPMRRPSKDPIWPNEKLYFDVTYFGMVAAEVTLENLPTKVINNRKVYHVRGNAKSSSVFSLFYKVDDSIETFIDYDGLFSHRFHLILNESKQTRDALELNDSEKLQTYYWNRWNHKQRGYTESKDFFQIPAFPQDSLSSIYYLRTIPLPTGSVITFPVVSEGKTWEAVVTVVRREMLETPLGKIQTIVLKPETKYQGILQKKGDSYIWLTDDEHRYLVQMEAKVRIGSVSARLTKIEKGTPP